VVCFVLHIVGILVFNEGFFLTRLELKNKSTCGQAPYVSKDGHKDSGSCWLQGRESRYKRAVVIVIDALRYDFVFWNDTSDGTHPFQNKLASVRDLLKMSPEHTLLFPFYADPPTTTIQRLKGMTTGGLPTFMEIKDDVASEGVEITEDNLVDLLVNHSSRNITFMGDDTWTVLFPGHFARSFPYPSFNVKDLHTVDEGVLDHLLPEMRRDDWSFLVAHFLGVDHCGHRYGPDNDEMGKKLLQMNQAIDDVVRMLNHEEGFEDTLLLVFGDHGMTADGNHGGATEEEVGAALLMYSPVPIIHAALEEETGRRTVDQIDLAPTLSLLLGLPIPFGSLGRIVPELFFTGQDDVARYRSLNEALEVNVGQVLRYLKEYSEKSQSKFEILEILTKQAQGIFRELHKKEADEACNTECILSAHRKAYVTAREILKQVSQHGRSLWTQFNLGRMAAGFLIALLGVVAGAVNTWVNMHDQPIAEIIISFLAVGLQMASRLSNSYIVSEPRVTSFITATLSAYMLLSPTALPRYAVLSILSIAVASRISVELAPIQWWRGQEALPGDGLQPWFVATCWTPLICVGFAVSRVFKGHTKTLLIAQFTLTFYHWAFQCIDKPSNWFPRAVYVLPLLNFVLNKANNAWRKELVALLIAPYLLVVGPASPAPIFLLLVQGFALLQVTKHFSTVFLATLWSTTSMSYFFATGHESFFNKLHYASPFVGFEEHEYFRGATMLGFNTFGIFILITVLLPVVSKNVPVAINTFIISQAMRAITMIAFVAMQRRHLMVWAIFAPKYVFDSVTLLVIDVAAIVTLLKY